jgi:hypothetical protein
VFGIAVWDDSSSTPSAAEDLVVNAIAPAALTTSAATARDTIALLYPYCPSTDLRTGTHPGKRFSASGADTAYEQSVFFQGEDLAFSGIREFHPAIVQVAAEGLAFPVRAARAHNGRFLRRTKQRIGKCPPGLRAKRLHILALDLDKWANLPGFDPRVDPVGAWRWMLSVLDLEDITVSAHWSSSCCVRVPAGEAPKTLSARIWLWMDRPLSERAAKSVLAVLNARARAFFEARGIVVDTVRPDGKVQKHNLVDPKVAEAQQPIYVADPLFEGLDDPMGGQRHALLEGAVDKLDVGPLLAQAPQDASPASVDGAPRAKAPRAKRTAAGRLRVPGEVLPLHASARLVQAHREMLAAAIKGGASEEFRAACTNLFHRRVALEMTALAIHRGGLAGTGTSDQFSTMIAAALVASLPLGWAPDRVRGEIRQLLVLANGAEWTVGEWEAGGYDAAILRRYEAASRGEKGAYGRDLRYGYSKARLLQEWEPTMEEIRELGLRSLASDADRAAADRDEVRGTSGAVTRDAWLAEARRQAPEVHRLRASGLSVRRIAEEAGLSVGKVLRLLALDAETVAEMTTSAPEGVVAADVADLVPVADPLPGAIRYAMASQGLDLPEEIADLLGEPLGRVKAAMEELGLWVPPVAWGGLRLAA